jgi:hypothetical protein
MIKLKDIILEAPTGYLGYRASAKKSGPVISTWLVRKMIVIEDLENGLADVKKREKILYIIRRALLKKTTDLDYDFTEVKPEEMIKNLNYFPKTDKIVGILPQYMFKKGKINFKNSLFYDELSRFYPTLNIREKKSIK